MNADRAPQLKAIVRSHRVIENHKAVRDLLLGCDRAASVGGEGGLVPLERIGFPFRRAPRFYVAGCGLSVEIKGRPNKGLQRTRVSMSLMQGLKVAAFVRAAEAQR